MAHYKNSGASHLKGLIIVGILGKLPKANRLIESKLDNLRDNFASSLNYLDLFKDEFDPQFIGV